MLKIYFACVGAALSTVLALAITGFVYVSSGANPELKSMEERWLVAPGALLARRVEESSVRRRAADELKDLPAPKIGAQVEVVVRDRMARLAHYYNVGVWSIAAFGLCLAMTVLLGVSSFLDAVALGFKVMCTLACAQAGLVLYLLSQHRI